ncbi:MAG: transposase, partial [Treponema sp.]|nr:transposase [Treponema sp.]
ESCPEVKKQLWGGEFWTKGYYIGTVGEHGSEQAIREYVRRQCRNMESYQKLHEGKQLELFSYQGRA